MYIHDLQGWPRFTWNREHLAEPLASVRHRQGRLIGHMEALGFNLRQEAVLQTLTGDVVQSSDIEGRRSTPSRSARRSPGGHGPRALGEQPATVLQHVDADPAGAQGLLRHSEADTEGNDGHHALGWKAGFSCAIRKGRSTSYSLALESNAG